MRRPTQSGSGLLQVLLAQAVFGAAALAWVELQLEQMRGAASLRAEYGGLQRLIDAVETRGQTSAKDTPGVSAERHYILSGRPDETGGWRLSVRWTAREQMRQRSITIREPLPWSIQPRRNERTEQRME